jgi:hypothetical protein
LAEGAVTLLRAEGVPPLVAVVVAVVLAGSAVAVSATSDLHTARTLTDTHILELSDDWGGGVTRDAAANLHDVLRPGEAVATDSGALVAYYVDAPTYYLPFKEGQTVDRADIDSVGVRLLDDLRARNVRWLVVQEPAGAKDPRTALADYSLVNGGLCLWRRFATGAIGPDSHPVAVDVFEMPPCRAPG